ncbi:GSCOCG00002648001-RA-CDS [Cotesia congregata]|nr:GSCOCG00002648001-RA-CDS [Cotesia congregata]
MHRQQSHPAKPSEQPLNLSSSPEVVLSSRKRHLGDTQEDKNQKPQLNLHLQSEPANQGSIIKDLLLKNRDDFVCANCKISYTSADNLEAHKRYYCKVSSSSSSLSSSSSSSSSPSPKRDFQLDLEKRDNDDTKSEYYNTVKPLPSPGPLLGNTRLVDAYTPPVKKHCLTELTVPPTSLRSLEELSKYPRPNSLQMFGGQVRILDNTGETKTMRIEPRQTNSPSDDMTNHNSKSGTSETSSIVVRSSLHSGGTMVHKPPGGTSVSSSVTNSLSNSISMPNAPQMLAPIIPNISTPNIAPTMTCYGNYLEPRLNPLTITAYNPLTLPSGISSIMHGGKIIPYVPGMPGPHTLMSDISQPQTDSYKLPVPGAQPLDLASPVKVGATTPYVPGIPGPEDSVKPLFTPLDLAKDPKVGKQSPSLEREVEEKTTKFLRPSSLPLKPGTFTPKRHHGITPTPYTQPLISPETPRPRKSYGQLYLNGHAYTYLGLKCSTRVYYCTLNRPQPMYVTQQHHLSMYSNWKIFNDLRPDRNLANYDSRNRSSSYTIAWKKQELLLTHSSYKPVKLNSSPSPDSDSAQKMARRIKIFDGGFESNEDYTYVRGRGRGRYVCEECGIRCKKPSMLKKHIRTHTDVRPYTCKYCSFSFKTKGNLTKHMKSKAHYKKCRELGIDPVPTTVCDENIDKEAIARLTAGGGENADESSEEEDDESDNEESEESGTDEHEAARSLLILSQPSKNRLQIPGLVPACRPATYPYALTTLLSTSTSTATTTTASTGSVTSATVIQSEAASNRYYFPSRSLDSSRDSVIRSTKVEEAKEEIIEGPAGEAEDHQGTRGTTQPMDLTTKPAILDCAKRSSVDILTPVSEPILMQTIVQTMERLPPGREWKPDAEGHMLQAYLTERHVMDSKIKQQYRVGGFKVEKKVFSGSKLENSRGSLFSSSTPTVTYTDSRMQFAGKKEDVGQKVEAKSERRPFDIESLHSQELLRPRVNTQEYLVGRNYPEVGQELKPLGNETREAVASHERQDFIPSPGREARYERPVRPVKDGRSTCGICNKVFNKPSQLKLHINIHYFERPFRCESCAVSFRTKGHLTKHERSVSHHNKVSMTSTFGAPTTSNPRPFKCTDCKIAFRIHGHLAKHLRSKMHIMKLECIGKLPFGTYAEMERSGVNLNDIDTTDCDNSLASLQVLAKKLYDQDPTKIGQWDPETAASQYQQSIPPTTTTTTTTSSGEASSDEGEPIPQFPVSPTSSPSAFTPATDIPSSVSRAYHSPILSVISDRNKSPVESHVPNSRFEDKNLPASSSSSVDTHLPNAFICQTCTTSFRNLVDLQVHCFVEHNIDNRNHPSESGPTNENNIKQTNDVDINKVHDKSDDA